MISVDEHVSRALGGDMTSVARLVTLAERDQIPDAAMARLHAASAGCHLVGVTGAPGSGKSTLVSALARHERSRGRSIGVLAVDPTSPYSGGAILGDRIRMDDLLDDPEVFVRSMATRGTLGGLARATGDAVTVLAAGGRDSVVIETVGVGQDEVEIVRASHTTVVVSVPGLGDDVQAMKAGVLEIADVHVVNKADLAGAEGVVAQLRDMLRLGGPMQGDYWRPPVLSVSATTGEGIEGLSSAIDDHRSWLMQSGQWVTRESEIAEARVRAALTEMLMAKLEGPAGEADFDGAVNAVRERRLPPRVAASQLLGSTITVGSVT